MRPSGFEPFFLLDESLSRYVASEVAMGIEHPIATIWDEWQGRDFSVNQLPDGEIISRLGARAGHLAVWITAHWDARRRDRHGVQIDAHRISVLWLRGPGRNPTVPEQRQMLGAVMETVRRLVVESDVPVYLRVRLESGDGYRPALERLQGTLLDTPLRWEPVSLE